MTPGRFSPGRRSALALLGAGLATPALPAAADALQRVRERGALVAAVYHDLPPFHAQGRGIDVDLAQALAEALGVRLALLPFHADESMADDLRHMVWRGHYLGHGPADVLLHVPVDAPLIASTPQARIFAPYYRERIGIARDARRLPRLESLAPLKGLPVAVAGASLAGWLLIGADDGAYRATLRTPFKDGTEAAAALQRGEAVAAAGTTSELEAALRGDERFVIEPLPVPRAPRDGWAVGMAVKADAVPLAEALQAAVNALVGDGRLAALFTRAGVSWRSA